jgi:hypothetical protein
MVGQRAACEHLEGREVWRREGRAELFILPVRLSTAITDDNICLFRACLPLQADAIPDSPGCLLFHLESFYGQSKVTSLGDHICSMLASRQRQMPRQALSCHPEWLCNAHRHLQVANSRDLPRQAFTVANDYAGFIGR